MQGLTGAKDSIWVHDPCPEGQFWKEDLVDRLTDAGRKKVGVLISAGIKVVGKIVRLSKNEFTLLKDKTTGISLKKLTKWRDKFAHNGACPHDVTNYCLALNLYKVKYGEKLW